VHVSPRLAAQRVALGEAVLHLDRATHRADDDANLDEAAVAGGVDSQLSRGLRPDPERTLVVSDRMARIDVKGTFRTAEAAGAVWRKRAL
jgi:hypothetical protein